MGVHTGDSITVAPAADPVRQGVPADARRRASRIIRRVGVETGGSNIQFAVDPDRTADGGHRDEPEGLAEFGLASKATGFPIAKIAAKLALGYTLDEIANDITGKTFPPRSSRPWTTSWSRSRAGRSRSSRADGALGTSMKSVGEAMAIGGTFKEALMKGRSLEMGRTPRSAAAGRAGQRSGQSAPAAQHPDWQRRMFAVFRRAAPGLDGGRAAAASSIDPWFLRRSRSSSCEAELACGISARFRIRFCCAEPSERPEWISAWPRSLGSEENLRGAARSRNGAWYRVYKRIDTCAAEFERSRRTSTRHPRRRTRRCRPTGRR